MVGALGLGGIDSDHLIRPIIVLRRLGSHFIGIWNMFENLEKLQSN